MVASEVEIQPDDGLEVAVGQLVQICKKLRENPDGGIAVASTADGRRHILETKELLQRHRPLIKRMLREVEQAERVLETVLRRSRVAVRA